MKNGIFKSISALFLGLCFLQLSSCASLLEMVSDEDPAEYDRGYAKADDFDSDVAAEDEYTEAEDAAGRAPAGLGRGVVRVRRAIETRDIILGMTRQDVMQSWGEPVQREVAGNGTSGHERCTYGSRYNFNGSRTVIFENGRVAGWKR